MRFAKLVLCGLLGIACVQQQAFSQSWPSKPVNVLNGYAAGGSSDNIIRPIAQHLSQAFGNPFLVTNKPGANANLAAMEVATAGPDGYVFLFATTSQLTINPALYAMPYNPQKDLLPITHISMNPVALVMNGSFPANTMKDLIAYAKANPEKLTYASAGVGSINHLAGELLAMITNTKMLHIPMKGGAPVLTELLAGRVDIFFSSPPILMPYVKAGKLKILMVSATKRMEQLPDVPTMTEAGIPDFQAQAGTGLLAPANTPRSIIERMNNEVVKYLKSDTAVKLLGRQGVQIVASTPEEFAAVIRSETERWAKVVKAGGMVMQ